MEITNVLTSSAVRILLPASTDNLVFMPDVAAEIRKIFRFVEGPLKVSDYDLSTGITFSYGSFKNRTIQTLKFYNNGLFVESADRTEHLDEVLDSIKEMLLSTFNLEFNDGDPISKLYKSRVEVKITRDVTLLFEKIKKLSEHFTSMVRGYGVDCPDAETAGFSIIFDATKVESVVKPEKFTFERRAGHAFEEFLFFSEAPLSTKQHLELLEELESLL